LKWAKENGCPWDDRKTCEYARSIAWEGIFIELWNKKEVFTITR